MGERSDKGQNFPLAMAQEGERVRIARLNGGHSLEIRLTDLGLNVGSELLISHRQGGQLVVDSIKDLAQQVPIVCRA